MNKKKIFLYFASFFILSLMLIPCYFVSAEVTGGTNSGELPNPLDTTDPNVVIGRIIKAILGLVGAVALLMFIVGGLTWMTAAGSKEKIEKGKNIIVWAILGLVVIFASYMLVDLVIKSVTKQ